MNNIKGEKELCALKELGFFASLYGIPIKIK
jgi:hypothetical protein